MFDYRRTHTCGELTQSQVDQTVTLSGWVHRRRDHGGVVFIDLRDRFGLTQLVFRPEVSETALEDAYSLRSEWVISVIGTVQRRTEGMVNAKLPTGEIEVQVSRLSVLSEAKTPPISVSDEQIAVSEEHRLRYRFLDLRRGRVAENLRKRHKVMMATRRYFDAHDFCEVTTPILGKSTPEGARDYLVPARLHPGQFYALPQSPQIFKQLLMISGMDRYYQIATCFRDEDLRADRQPEFTQIDLEMSFQTQEELFALMEGLMVAIFEETRGEAIKTPFQRMDYREALDRYGTDKPDLRFGMEHRTLSDIAQKSDFSVFKEQLQAGGLVKGICVKGGADISRKTIEAYTAFVGRLGIKGLAWMKVQSDGLSSNIVKFFAPDLQQELVKRFEAETGDLLLFVADQPVRTHQALDHLRRHIAKERGLIPEDTYHFLWVTNFPYFEYDAHTGHVVPLHHPFTAPLEEDLPLFDSDIYQVRSSSYDLVLNGYELGSGSQRIHDGALQRHIFELLQLSPDEIEKRFGFFVEALQYGTPPHLGIALGFDRLMMILCHTDNIRDVIAFPKTQKATDLMMEAPSTVLTEQLRDLQLKIEPSEFA